MKTFKFFYEDIEYVGDNDNWPHTTTIKTTHEFDDTTTWVPVLYQFAKFLESTGYVGVIDKIQVQDNYGMNIDCGFETFTTEEDDIVGVAKVGTPEWDEAMGELNTYLNSLSKKEKDDVDRIFDNKDKDAQ